MPYVYEETWEYEERPRRRRAKKPKREKPVPWWLVVFALLFWVLAFQGCITVVKDVQNPPTKR